MPGDGLLRCLCSAITDYEKNNRYTLAWIPYFDCFSGKQFSFYGNANSKHKFLHQTGKFCLWRTFHVSASIFYLICNFSLEISYIFWIRELFLSCSIFCPDEFNFYSYFVKQNRMYSLLTLPEQYSIRASAYVSIFNNKQTNILIEFQ